MATKRSTRETSLSVWFNHADNSDHQETLNILNHFKNELKSKNGYKHTSDHKLNLAVLVMAFKALAKSKRPDLLMPRDSADVILDRLVTGMYEVQEELQLLAEKVANGVVIQSGDLSRVAGKIPTGYGSFEQSIADGFTSFSDEDE